MKGKSPIPRIVRANLQLLEIVRARIQFSLFLGDGRGSDFFNFNTF